MYLLIQKRINYILTILFIFLAILLYILFFPIFRYWGFTGMIISFMILILIFHFLIDNAIKHTEDIIIYRMLSKKQIALCQIKKVQFYKTKKDFYFRNHHIYQFDIELYTQDHQTIQTIIYEDIKHPYFSSLPTYAYVTYNGDLKKIGLISTFYIFMTPKIKSIIREYEKIYQPSYVEIIKKNGLTTKRFIDSQ